VRLGSGFACTGGKSDTAAKLEWEGGRA